MHRIAVIIPCYNEELTIRQVVMDARKALPDAEVFVFDNNSTDQTKNKATQAGASVIVSPLQGKGNVVRHAFRVIEADYYVMVDGDDTYPIEQAVQMIQTMQSDGFDMAVGVRLQSFTPGAFRRFHLFGNHLLSKIVSSFFSQKVTDMLSGFRVFSKDFVEQVPLHSTGFEIETELTLQALSKNFPVIEVPISYRERPEGSVSKLQTFGDGFLILSFIFKLMKDYRPLHFFFSLAGVCAVLGLACGWAPIQDFIQSGYVYTLPRAVLAASFMILATLFMGVGLILDSHRRYFADQFVMMQKVLRQTRSTEKNKTQISQAS